jgi:prepilin-type N-terminal cleavage/methylation domain-containing protein
MRKNHKGFSVIEVIVVLALIGLIGFVGWYAWQHKNARDKSAQPSTSSTTESDSADSYAGWKTYTSPREGFSIKYPANWTLKAGAANANGVFDPSIDAVSIAGPNDFTLGYDILKPTASTSCANCSFTLVDSVRLKNDQLGYIVINSNTVNGNIAQQALSISKSQTFQGQSDQGWPYYKSFADSDKLVRWKGSYPDSGKGDCGGAGCDLVSISLADFKERAEVKTAEQILRSIKY